MNAGRLRHFADIEYFVKTGTDTRGQPVGTWQVLYSAVPMSIDPLTGKLAEIKRQLVASATHHVCLRYLPGVTASMRVSYMGRYFYVGFVDEGDFKQHDLWLTCTEQTKGATPNG